MKTFPSNFAAKHMLIWEIVRGKNIETKQLHFLLQPFDFRSKLRCKKAQIQVFFMRKPFFA